MNYKQHFGGTAQNPTFLGYPYRVVDDSDDDCRRWTLELLVDGHWDSWSWCALDEKTLFEETLLAWNRGEIPRKTLRAAA